MGFISVYPVKFHLVLLLFHQKKMMDLNKN